MITEAWYLAQEYFLNDGTNRMIPLEDWRKRKAPDAVIEVGLAEIIDGKVYVCGSNEQFDWLLKRSENGKKGGIASAQKRSQAKLELAQAPVEQGSSKEEANASKSNPLTLTHSLTLNNTYCQADHDEADSYVVLSTELFTGNPLDELSEAPTSDDARNVITLLNSILFTHYRANNKNLRFVNARLREGYSLEDFKKVFEFKKGQWDGTDMAQYLRPSTLLGTKFDEYLAQAQQAANPSDTEINKLLGQHIISMTGSFS